jgi:competence protein ComFC
MSRKDRFAQLKDAFEVEQSAKLKDAQILLIDDVLTTGATIESAAKTLKQAGAKTVDVAVFAH